MQEEYDKLKADKDESMMEVRKPGWTQSAVNKLSKERSSERS